jgi:hypothetical protein
MAQQVGKKYGVPVKPAKGDGWVIEVPGKGGKQVTVRVMHKGGGRTEPYYRISVTGKGTVSSTGGFSSDRALTHIDIHTDSLPDIYRLIDVARKK